MFAAMSFADHTRAAVPSCARSIVITSPVLAVTCTISVNCPVAASMRVSLKKLVPATGLGNKLPAPVFTVSVVALAFIDEASTVEALFDANRVKDICPPDYQNIKGLLMNNFAAALIKILLASLSTLTIALSCILLVLCFEMWAQDGMPALLTIKLSLFMFSLTILSLIICACLKMYLSIVSDNRTINEIKKKKVTIRHDNEDIRV